MYDGINNRGTQKVELDILLDFAAFCEKNGLSYFLAYGTLIGAIRHKGFIPWDDDIDVWMPRADYDRLQEMFNDQHQNSAYQILLPTDKRSCYSFAKIVDNRTVKLEKGVAYDAGFSGVDVDIFPLDGQPESDARFDGWYNRLQRLYRGHFSLIRNKVALRSVTALKIEGRRFLTRVFLGDKNALLKKAAEFHAQYPYEQSQYVGTVECCFNDNNERFPKEWFEKAVDVDFEGHVFQMPGGYHEILTQIYGDYMSLPPEEQRVTHHRSNAYWNDENI